MNRATPPRTPRKLLATLGVLGLMVGLGVTLTQCRMVTDELLGARVAQTQSASSCINKCAHAYNDSIRVESALHVENVHACDGDEECLDLEDARHEAAVNRIQAGRQDCMNRCHHQGGGKGGR